MDRHSELSRLSEADQHLADAERRITVQEVVLETLRRDGHNTGTAEKTLAACTAILEVSRQRRETIIKRIAQIDQGLI